MTIFVLLTPLASFANNESISLQCSDWPEYVSDLTIIANSKFVKHIVAKNKEWRFILCLKP